MPALRPYRRQPWEFNRCGVCGKFRPWEDLELHFVPDTAFSSESESYRECTACFNESHARGERILAAAREQGVLA
jgi:hypothetical protein